MNRPSVTCIMLTADRHDMARRAVESFLSQSYKNKRLLIYDTGHTRFKTDHAVWIYDPNDRDLSVGALRNAANANAVGWGMWHLGRDEFVPPDILVHWDDDDSSHPDRLTEQVALLQSSGADCVGYRDLLFWKTCSQCHGFDDYCADVAICETCKAVGGESWLYTSTRPDRAPGTSLCYWAATWRGKRFPDLPRPGNATGEDVEWQRDLKVVTVSSLNNGEPRMIASIHGGNTSGQYRGIGDSTSWRRVPEFDQYCRDRMRENPVCPWCNTIAKKATARHEGTHATWCVHFKKERP